ncbi:dihydrodipicolinate synthase family protein [Dongia deserti]|uniref:dihydrodipicolinate synthase family protein n=1 Tax=Dongia deserti TaxID=2268030 RepID=UPI000E658307|nr:dihydrodipicolinate synthase family protein [Dongia deserti]
MAEIKGICVPTCTPFDSTGDNLNEKALSSHIERLLEAGVHAVVSCGGTGEFAYLSEAERRQIHQLVAKQVRGRARFVAQSSAVSTRDTIENAKFAEGLGADALMILPPYFEGPIMDGVMWHFEAVARAIKTPIIVYNIPQNTNRDITPDLFSRLLQIENIQYIKDSTGDFTRIQQLVATGGKVLNGGDTLAFPALLAGCPGLIWGGANATPNEAVRLYDLVTKRDLDAAAALWKALLPAQLFYWTHDYNSSVKAATNLLGGNVGICRKPALPLPESQVTELKSALLSLGRPIAATAQ